MRAMGDGEKKDLVRLCECGVGGFRGWKVTVGEGEFVGRWDERASGAWSTSTWFHRSLHRKPRRYNTSRRIIRRCHRV